MQKIKQPDTCDTMRHEIELYRNDDIDDSLTIIFKREGAGGGFTVDAHRARQLYNAIGAVMGFDKPAKTRTSPKDYLSRWEEVTNDPKGAGHTYRLRVEGGYLYRTVTTVPGYDGEEPIPVAQSTVFVPTIVKV